MSEHPMQVPCPMHADVVNSIDRAIDVMEKHSQLPAHPAAMEKLRGLHEANERHEGTLKTVFEEMHGLRQDFLKYVAGRWSRVAVFTVATLAGFLGTVIGALVSVLVHRVK